MSKLMRAAWSAGLCCSMLVLLGCEPNEPPPPPKPSAAPLAGSRPQAPSSPQLPPGHPPIDQPATAAASPSGAELPPGHPPITPQGGESAQGADGLPPGHPPITPPGGAMGGVTEMPPAVPPQVKEVEAKTQFAGLSLTPPAGWKAFDAGSGPLAPVAAFLLERAEGDSADASARLTHFPDMRGRITLEQQLERWFGQVQQPDGRPTSEVAKTETFQVGEVVITLADMTGSIAGVPNQRMLAAMIVHAEGPHFLKVQGPASTVEKWYPSVLEYLKSAKVTPAQP
jgi:hypothetical protein